MKKKRNDLLEFLKELIDKDPEFKKEVEYLDLKYKIIEEFINYRETRNLSRITIIPLGSNEGILPEEFMSHISNQ